ncbi:MAG: helicase-associated domain-containing protein [candidate division KSB1 bacterium]|nr:helicase-associated domain-containing protein [candidate division KSB1 bacterium]
MTIDEILNLLPRSQVETIASKTGASMAELERQLIRGTTFKNSYANLSRRLRHIVDFVFRQQGEISFSELQKKTTVTRFDLRLLTEKALLFALPNQDNPEKVVIPNEYFFLVDLPDPDPRSLITGLKNYQSDEIKRIASYHGFEENQPKAWYASRIFSRVTQNIESIITTLTPEEREILGFVSEWEGMVGIYEFKDQYPKLLRSVTTFWGLTGAELLGNGSFDQITPVQKLFLLTLLIPIRQGPWNTIQYIAIPRELYPVVARDRIEARAQRREALKQGMILSPQGKQIQSNEVTLAQDLKKILLITESLRPRTTAKGIPYTTDLKKIGQFFNGDLRYLQFLFVYAKFLELIEPEDFHLVTTENGPYYVNLTPKERLLLAQKFFLENESLDLAPIEYFTQEIRRLVVEILKDFNEEFSKASCYREYAKYFPQYLNLREYCTQAYSHFDISSFEKTVEETLELLSWLGLVEYLGNMEGVRLSASGRYLFEGRPMPFSPSEPEEEKFIVQPNYEIIAVFNTRFEVLRKLALFTSIKSLDLSIVFGISKPQLIRAIDQGMSAQEIYHFLEQGSKVPLPQPVKYLLEELQKREGEIELKSASGYIKIRDPHLLQEIKLHLKGNVEEVLGNQIIILKQDADLSYLEKLLKRKGYFVKPFSLVQEPISSGSKSLAEILKTIPPPQFNAQNLDFPNPAFGQQEVERMFEFAIKNHLKVKIEYQSEAQSTSFRIIEPRKLLGGLVEAYCHQREAVRVFRTDRIAYAELIG